MRRIYAFLSIIAIVAAVTTQAQTTFTLNLDKSIILEPQTIYLTGYDSRISRNEFLIFDSVYVNKGQMKTSLSTTYPYDNFYRLFFSKNGPTALEVVASPGEKIEIDIDENTPIAGEIKVRGGKLNNRIVEFKEQEVEPINQKIRYFKAMESAEGYDPKDSLHFYCQKQVDNQLANLEKTDEGMIAIEIWTIITHYRKAELSEEAFQRMTKSIQKKYASNPKLASWGKPYKGIKPTEKSEAHSARMVEQYKAKNTVILKDTTLHAYLSVTLPDSNGNLICTDSIHSEYTLVDFWATWCAPCKKEFPSIKEAQEKYKENLSVYFVSLDRDRDKWKEYISESGTEDYTHVIGIKKSGEENRQIKALGIRAIPRNFLLDKEHRIIAKDLRGEELMHLLDELMNKK